jgi:predicted ArsR family transcriptional regulator
VPPPITVADLASAIALPLGVVRVLLDDLVQEQLAEVRTAAARGRVTDRHLLKQVLDGPHAL